MGLRIWSAPRQVDNKKNKFSAIRLFDLVAAFMLPPYIARSSPSVSERLIFAAIACYYSTQCNSQSFLQVSLC